METNVNRTLAHVTAARALYSTRGLRIAQGAHGIVAEDRGSELVVFFDEQDSAVNLSEPDLRAA